MLCSISTGKSGSNWLDRLRSNKGFPTGDNLGLDHFLSNHSNPDTSDSPITTNASNSLNSNSDSTQSDDQRVTNRAEISCEDKHEEREWFGVMSNVLSELFNMGGPSQSSTFSGKKSSRKQTNPKFCVTPAPNNYPVEEQEKSSDRVRKDGNAQHATASLNSDNNESAAETKEEKNHNSVEFEDVEEEEEEGERELLGYSRSEVTVIDTSFGSWKFDKLVYRRKNVWKVRDKKGKSRVVGKKKRKGNVSDDNFVGSKKAKVLTSELPSINVHEQYPQGKREEDSKETPNDFSEVPKRRCPRKSRKGVSSVIIIEGIPTSKKSEGIPTSKISGANNCESRSKDTKVNTRPDGP